MIGILFERLTPVEMIRKHNRIYYVCECSCGSGIRKEVRDDKLKDGSVTSCGCIKKEQDKLNLNRVTHGFSIKKNGRRSSEYHIWANMIARCTNKNSKKYSIYGKRGIKVCDEWFNFENFIKDMGKRPSADFSIERMNNDGNYCKENCRWATRIEQGNNKRNNIKLTFKGIIKTAKEWAKETGLSVKLIYERHSRGWTDEECLSKNTDNDPYKRKRQP